MTYQIGDHNKNSYNGALEKYVKSHSSGKNTFFRITRLFLHNVCFALFKSESQSRETVCNQVDPEKMYRFQYSKSDHSREENCQNLCQIGGKQELDCLTDVRINTASLFYCGYDGCKVIVCQYHIGYIFGYVCSGDSHTYANVSALNGRSVINAVTGHGCDHAFLFPCIYNTYFMLRLNSGIYRKLFDSVLKILIADLIKLCACDSLRRIGKDSKLHTDGNCGILMISGNHNRTDSCFTALYNCSLNLRTDRIDHSGKSQIGKFLFQKCRLCTLRHFVPFTACTTENTKSSVSHCFVTFQNRCSDLFCHRNLCAVYNRMGTAFQHLVRSTLGKLDDLVFFCFVNGGHHFTHGIKRSFSHTYVFFF